MEKQTDTVTIDQLAQELGLSDGLAVLSAMQVYNQSLPVPKERMSARWLATAKKDGIKLRNMKPQQWLSGFRIFVNNGFVDKERGLLTDTFTQALQDGDVAYTPPSPSETAPTAVDSLPTDIRECVGFMSDTTASNAGLRASRSDMRGYYRLIRASTRDKRQEYYEEAMFFGDVNEPSWLAMSTRQTPRIGFSFAGTGTGFVVLSAPHSSKLLSGSMITLYGYDETNPRFLTGVMSRLSDDRSRPAAMLVLAIREDDPDVVATWEEAYAKTETQSLCRTITETSDPQLFAMLEEFDLKHNVKGHLLDQWLDLMDKYNHHDAAIDDDDDPDT